MTAVLVNSLWRRCFTRLFPLHCEASHPQRHLSYFHGVPLVTSWSEAQAAPYLIRRAARRRGKLLRTYRSERLGDVAINSVRNNLIKDGILGRDLPPLVNYSSVRVQRFPVTAAPRNGMTVELFLKTLGRGCQEHIELFKTWDELMNFRTKKLKELGIPFKRRKWILHWVEQYKQGRDPVYISKVKSRSKRNLKERGKKIIKKK